jgi:hypothetical protein
MEIGMNICKISLHMLKSTEVKSRVAMSIAALHDYEV